MPIKLNFKGVSSKGFEPFEVGVPLPFTIFNITQEVGKESKQPYLKFEFQMSGGKRKAWRNYSLQPQSLFMLKNLLVQLDYEEEDLEAEDFDFNPTDILGREVYLTFGPEKEGDNGFTSQEIVKVKAEA